MAHIVATQTGKEITLWVSHEGAMVPLASAANLPDAKLAARGRFIQLQHQLERVGMKDVRDPMDPRT